MTRFDDLFITCDKRPFLVKVLSDAVQAGQVDDSQAKTFDNDEWLRLRGKLFGGLESKATYEEASKYLFLYFYIFVFGSTYEDAGREVEKDDIGCKS